ncbi:DUF4908 domain-containing protein [Amphiplicatus metriothermophilus]|uniref:DUF4908 domain-containing protein n=1 Tax=Amphiplicatus metriothermophilus TaxID=1519374 RepID=A0A239PIY5_9PROT|nr:DUF4908 domain-containing protein [Amphiplicatus metriothermophilus]MBB5517929.1 hypothetical protein [Amphiplicatus metriothermophilus]SNT67738.1 protein of unknown function [Amphiplicatus metriothermophilus]
MNIGAVMAGALMAVSLAAGDGPSAAPFAPGRAVQIQVDDNPFSTLVGKRRERALRDEIPTVERFITASGERAFLLMRGNREARIQFLCAPGERRIDCQIDPDGRAEEIYALRMMRGPRGDLLFKDAEGETVLRITVHGGASVLWPGETQRRGAYRSVNGAGEALELAAADRAAALRRAERAGRLLSERVRADIRFVIPAAEEGRRAGDALALAPQSFAEEGAARVAANEDASVLADAIVRVAAGMSRVADDPTGARVLGARIATVRFTPAGAPSLALEGDALVVAYNAAQGAEGRPSSGAVARFLEESL